MKAFKLKGKFEVLDNNQKNIIKGGSDKPKGPVIGGTPPPIGLGFNNTFV